jgi:Domain of unknown function (DU1801)
MSIPDDVAAVFDTYPPATRQRLLDLRRLIFETAAATEGIGAIEETLKWGQISYLTAQTKSGTTIRIDASSSPVANSGIAMFVNCRTDLVTRFRQAYPGTFIYEGERAVVLDDGKPIDRDALKHCIAMALTYHRRKSK